MDDLLLIGAVVAPFGVRGQVKVKAFTDRPDHIARHVRTLYIGPEQTEYRLRRLFEHKPGLLVAELQGITSRDAAEELRGDEIYIKASDAAPLDPDEYFIHDLIGLAAQAEDGTPIGKVRDVMETGAGNILVISRQGAAEALVPLVRDFIAELDIPGGKVVIRPIEGLL
jgi:16S rRNA processing protein RimM